MPGENRRSDSDADANADADERIESLIDAASAPEGDDAPVFEAPWQARVFGLAVSMERDAGQFEWQSFQERLAVEIGTDEISDTEAVEEDYYQRWLSALERLMIDEGHLTEQRIRDRAREFADGDRTAAEFVEGDHEH